MKVDIELDANPSITGNITYKIFLISQIGVSKKE